MRIPSFFAIEGSDRQGRENFAKNAKYLQIENLMKRYIFVAREFDEFSRIMAANGYEIVNLPLIKTLPVNDLSDFEAKITLIEKYDGVFLTSRCAAQIFADKLRDGHVNYSGKVYVLGKRGFEVLRNRNLDLFYDETVNSARELLEKIASEDLQSKRFLFVRGEKSLRVVPEFLSKVATIDEAIVYETRKIAIGIDELKILREKFEKSEIAAACFFSPSAAKSFTEQFGAEITHQTVIATIGRTTAEFFERRNLKADFVSSKAAAEDFAVELVKYLPEEI